VFSGEGKEDSNSSDEDDYKDTNGEDDNMIV